MADPTIVPTASLGLVSGPFVDTDQLVITRGGIALRQALNLFMGNLQVDFATTGTIGNGGFHVATTGRVDIVGGLTTLFADGSAEFANGGIIFSADGSGSLANDAITWGADGSANFANGNIFLAADGSASFAVGKITLNLNGSANFADGNFLVGVDGNLSINGNVQLNPDGSASFASGNILLNADGSVGFAGGNFSITTEGFASTLWGSFDSSNATFAVPVAFTAGVKTVEGDVFYAHTVAGNLVWTTSP